MLLEVRRISDTEHKISLGILDKFFYRGWLIILQNCELRDLFPMMSVCFNELIQFFQFMNRLNVFDLDSFQGSSSGDKLIFECMLLKVAKDQQLDLGNPLMMFTFNHLLYFVHLFLNECTCINIWLLSCCSMSICWNSSMVLVLRNSPAILNSTGPDLSSSVVSPKL